MFRAILRCTDVRGRASRSEYWQFVLLQGLVGMVFGVLRTVLFMSNPVLGLMLGAVQGLLTLALALPGFTVAIRRLHDTGRSGWWLLLTVPAQAGVVFLVFGGLVLAYASASGGGLASAVGHDVSGWLIGLLIFALVCAACAVTLLVFMCQKGTRGPNRFGPDPLDPDSVPEADVFGDDSDVPPPSRAPAAAPARSIPVNTAPARQVAAYTPASPLQAARPFGKRR